MELCEGREVSLLALGDGAVEYGARVSVAAAAWIVGRGLPWRSSPSSVYSSLKKLGASSGSVYSATGAMVP